MTEYMKILFVFTGGTIGSSASGNYISPDKNKPYLLLQKYKQLYGMAFDFDTAEPYTELSENNNGETLSKLVDCLKENLIGKYDGIVVTHGTDTLQYSAAALSYTLNADVPVCIVSSNFPIENPMANGLVNLRAAVSFIEKVKTPGVWVAYKNSGEPPKLHRGTRLLAGQSFTDNIYSIKNSFYGWFDENFEFHKNESYSELADQTPALPCGNLNAAAEKIMRIEPYPGMVYPELGERIGYIVHGSYHSGTVNTKTFLPADFFLRARNNGVKILLTGVSDGMAYGSARLFDELGIVPVMNISPIAVYVKLWLCVSAGIDPTSVIEKSLGGDIVM